MVVIKVEGGFNHEGKLEPKVEGVPKVRSADHPSRSQLLVARIQRRNYIRLEPAASSRQYD
jgi:hypothetical protein